MGVPNMYLTAWRLDASQPKRPVYHEEGNRKKRLKCWMRGFKKRLMGDNAQSTVHDILFLEFIEDAFPEGRELG